jgi:proline iminopeptidase
MADPREARLSSPLDNPWRINRAWPDSQLIVIDDEGHGGEAMMHTWQRVLADLA